MWVSQYSDQPQFPNLYVMPCGLIPKGAGFRAVDGWSCHGPLGFSINEHLDKTRDVCDNFDRVVYEFVLAGPSASNVKGDFKSAYRQVRVRARDLHLGGLTRFRPGFRIPRPALLRQPLGRARMGALSRLLP